MSFFACFCLKMKKIREFFPVFEVIIKIFKSTKNYMLWLFLRRRQFFFSWDSYKRVRLLQKKNKSGESSFF